MKINGYTNSDYSDEKSIRNEKIKASNLSNSPATCSKFDNSMSKANYKLKEYSIFDSPLKEIHEFLLNYENEEIDEINKIIQSFRQPSIEYLHNTFGYNRSILKLCSWLMQLNKIDITDNEMNDYFWKIMDLRLDENDGKIINKWIENIEQIEEQMLQIIKETTKEYLTCCICKENPVSILYLPCGHVIICSKCYESSMKQCQICRISIDEVFAIYM